MTQITTNLVKFVQTTNSIKGVSFASLRGYSRKDGEVSNYLINVGVSLNNQKAKDLKELKELHLFNFYTEKILPLNNPKFTLELLQIAFVNVYNSKVKIGDKEYNGAIKLESNRSKAQTSEETYQVINNCTKFSPKYNRLYVYGMLEKKTVVIPSEIPSSRNASTNPRVQLQNILKRGMKSEKYRNFILECSDTVNLKKQSFEGMDLVIDM